MTWDSSKRVVPTDWPKRKARALRDHAGRCHICGHPGAEQVDHVLNVARGGTHEPSNLAPAHGLPCPTCGRKCHTEKTQAESLLAKPKTKREPEKHPGLL